jgi:4-hydroxyphenylpyruvate dioxygenase
VVLRYVSGVDDETKKTFLPKYADARPPSTAAPLTYGLRRLDHAVGNVHDLLETVDYITAFTGMHQFAEFTAEDVGTVDSGLNSMVLANNNEFVLLPVNEPTFGTKRKSQIQTYLEQNDGPGLQHLALKTDDVFATVRAMRAHGGGRGGFEFQAPASAEYYQNMKARVGEDALSPEQFAQVQELGLLVDRDDQGVLVQIFTKPLGDRPTVFIARAEAGDGRSVARARASRGLRRLRQGQLLGALQEHREVRANARGVRRGVCYILRTIVSFHLNYGSLSNHMFAKGLLCA